MKYIFKNNLGLSACLRCSFRILPLIILFSAFNPQGIMAEITETFEGTFQGANCVHYRQDCPDDDAHIALEHDFVLLLPSGEHYFLPNLNRAIKARYVAKPVRISGKVTDHEIWVKSLDVKMHDKYSTVWSWEKQQELYEGGGGE